MARHKDKKEDLDKERMTAAVRRLEDLLQNPVSGRPFETSSEQIARDGEAITSIREVASKPPQKASAPGTATAPSHGLNFVPDAADSLILIAHPRNGRESLGRLAWARRLAGDSEAPPERATIPAPKIEFPKGVRPGVKKPAAASADGLFGVLLSWLLGQRQSEVKDAIAASRRAFKATFLFSAVIKLLMLAGPLFVLHAYDRVLPSGSFTTLITLTAITAVLLAAIGMLELARSRIMNRIGVEIDERLGDRIFEAAVRKSLATRGTACSTLRELDSLRQFIAGPAPITFFDTPWTPVYLFAIFTIHWMLGVIAVAGTVILLALAWLTEQGTRHSVLQATYLVAKSVDMAETAQHTAEAITGMGMLGAYRSHWQALNAEGVSWQLFASDRTGIMAAIVKAVRMLLQLLMLALAAVLTIQGTLTPGAMIAATIIFGFALSPLERIIGHWRDFTNARDSCAKLEDILSYAPPFRSRAELPRPSGVLEVQNIRVAAPETRNLILDGIAFKASPGQMIAIVGPTASGKSTLVRAIVGLWPAISGAVTLDGKRIDLWHPEDLGKHIGYVPQNVELLSGTVKRNIARFCEDATDEQVMEAAKQAHAHELILSLPKGYDTEVGKAATHLTDGQRQRIALARALFGMPPLVMLDEPSANLDQLGDDALSAAIDGMRLRGQTVIHVSHRIEAIDNADMVLLLQHGQQLAFGPPAEVMTLLKGPPSARCPTGRAAPENAVTDVDAARNSGSAAP